MRKEQKEQVVSDLTERLRSADTLLVADYRGLTMPQIDALRTRLLESGARLTVVKNTLTRRAAEAAGADALLALLEGPSAIAFLEAEGDMVAAAKALADAARETRVLAIRGGVLEGKVLSAGEVESLATLPPLDILRGQVLGAVIAPLTTFVGLISAPLQNLIGLVDARIEQLGGAAGAPDTAADAAVESGEPEAQDDGSPGEPQAEAEPVDSEEPAEDNVTTSPQPEAADGSTEET